tara:strand:+ start:583 stop:1053 length:471 start_codon:yes stop_codon:yes gene_type:complete
MIDKAYFNCAWHYNMYSVATIICKEAGPCQLDLLLPQIDVKHCKGWMTQQNAVKFLDWYAESMPAYEYVINNLAKAIKAEEKQRRAVSRKYRWHIAHRQEYKCNICKDLLHPDSLDVDHVEEIQDGGADEIANLQALCSNCHAKKTRSHGRRKRKR